MSTTNNDRAADNSFRVVVNEEEQYSIWPVNKDIPGGWKELDKKGTQDECLAYINEIWKDMRPLSLRNKMKNENRGKKRQSKLL